LAESLFATTGFWHNGFRQNVLWQNVLWQNHPLLQLDSGRMYLGRITVLLLHDFCRMDLGSMYFGRITFCTNWIQAECI
jgi:hypothetical protein